MQAKEKISSLREYNPIRGVPPFPDEFEETETTVYEWPNQKDERFNEIETGFFVDLQAGLVRKGPALGLRYQQRESIRPVSREGGETAQRSYWQLYGIFRF